MEGFIEETDLVKDGRKAMLENPNPEKFFVVRNVSDNSVRMVYKHKDKDHVDLKKFRVNPEVRVTGEWYKDADTASQVLGFQF